MKRVSLLLGVCLVTSLALAPAAGAQETPVQSSAAIAENAPLPPAYVLERDGTVINEGDVVTDCNGFLTSREQGYKDARNEQEAQAVADRCQQLGVPSSDLNTGNSEVVLSLGTTGPPAPPAPGTEELPDTGGLPLGGLYEVAALATGLALIGGGLLLRRRAS